MSLLDALFPKRAVKAQLQDLLALPWSIRDETAMRTLAQYLREPQALAAAAAYGRGSRAEPMPYSVSNGVAMIDVCGPILRGESWLLDYFGVAYARTEEIERAMLLAAADPSVKKVCMCIDSPGGTTAGLQAAADAVAACNAAKEVTAYVTGQCCSAAYMLASQAGSIQAAVGSPIGSIGTYMVLVDSSKAAADAGIEVLVIRSGEMKGVGTDGAPITDKQRASLQAYVDSSQAVFNEYVAKGREMTLAQVKALATGEFWLASDALAKGLVDSVGPLNLGAESAQVHKEEKKMAMDEKEISARFEALESANKAQAEQLAKAAAESEAMKVALQAAQGTARSQILSEGIRSGRITPAMQASVQAFATACGADLASLQAFVDALPVQVVPAPKGTVQTRKDAAAIAGSELTEKDIKIQKQLLGGVDMKALAAADLVVSVGSDGMALLKDGTSRPLAEVMGE